MKKILLVILLSGCASATVPTAPLIAHPDRVIYIDSALLKPCRAQVEPEIVTYESVLVTTKTNTSIYVECRNRMKAAIVVLKKFSNLNP